MQEISELEPLIASIRAHAADALLVLVAFDGVLVDYVDDPEAVHLSKTRRGLLAQLLEQRHVALGIVSGRRVDDLRRRVGLPDSVFYVGLHGLEVIGPAFTRVQRDTLREHRDQVRQIASAVAPSIAEIDGARLENKEGAIALHTRAAGSADAVWARLHLLNRAADLVNARELRVYRGNHVLELLPNHDRVRADAVAAIQRHVRVREGRGVFTLYLAEDLPDDDALEEVRKDGVTAVVGTRPGSHYLRLRSVDAVDRFMTEVAAARAEI